MIAPERCTHGCVGWCATCDWNAAHPEGLPVVRSELPGRAAVTCPRKGCGHALSAHKDGICTEGKCACGLPAASHEDSWGFPSVASLRDVVRGIAEEVADEQPVIALMLRRALRVTGARP